MKLEYIAAGSADCPLIRLYDFGDSDVMQFVASIDLLAKGRIIEIWLDGAPYIEKADGCCLVLKIGKKDRGVLKTGDNSFDWILTDEGWIDVVHLARPFLEGPSEGRFQWLDERGEVRVLLSQDGRW